MQQTQSPKAERKVYVPELNGSITFTDDGGMVDRSADHWFIERNGRTDDEIINEALDTVQSPKAGERTQFTPGPRQGKYGKAVVACSIDPEFTAWAVIRPFCGTRWFKTVDEAELACEEYNQREIPRGAIAEGSEHPLSKGDIVDVHNNTPSGKEITEGRATIVSPTLRAHRYNVRFHGDGHNMTYERFVKPEHQITA